MPEPMNLMKIEEEILSWWKAQNTYHKVKEKGKKGRLFYFLDGPPYTSGKVHIGTAWNKSLKDAVIRYKRMCGFNVYDRAGYDMHGLPIEHKVEAKFGIRHKDEIPTFGVERFVRECEKFSLENMQLIKRLGVWMDFENAYTPITEESIEAIWWLIKKVHEQKRLYQGERALSWCPNCATALAKHELEYSDVTDTSVYLRFKLKSNPQESFLVWTTTPWTIPFNLCLVVHPDFLYVKCKVDDQIWIIAKDLAEKVIGELMGKSYTVVDEVYGREFLGIEYVAPFSDAFKQIAVAKKTQPKIYTVLLSSEYINLEDGTGVVHFAPGCGESDYELCQRHGIKPFNLLDENGVYPEHPLFGGLVAKKNDKEFAELMKKNGSLIHQLPYLHSYAHCWRCKSAIIYRTTKQWFFHVEDLKEKMVYENKTAIHWIPQSGFNAFDAWLTNLRDNSITKQRYWGTPLPVWQCTTCSYFEVLATKKEIERKSGITLKNLHKPWIDEATYPCEQPACNGMMKRIADVMDVWIDPGCASWICVNYPREKQLFEKLFPAEFILEGKDQIRGWFNVLMVCSMLAFGKISFRNVYMHGFVQDAQGRKMSKSLGNIISPYEVIDKYGADAFRFYMIGGARAGLDFNYNVEELEAKMRSLNVLWNLHHYLMDLCSLHHIKPAKLETLSAEFGAEERYMRQLNALTIRKATDLFEQYEVDSVLAHVESLFLSLSRDYIQWKRESVSAGEDIECVISTLWQTLHNSIVMLAPFCPMLTEKIYQNLKIAFGLPDESVHMMSWPSVQSTPIDPELQSRVGLAKEAIGGILAAREKLNLGIRWPLKEAVIVAAKPESIAALEELQELIMRQTNIKQVHIVSVFDKLTYSIKPDYKQLGPDFGKKAPAIIAKLLIESSQTILSHIEREGYFSLAADGETYKIVKEHLIVEQQVEPPFVLSQTPQFSIYVSGERTDVLEAEGYAREIMRRFQQLRKSMGLSKPNVIIAYLRCSSELAERLKPWKEPIAKRISASTFDFGERLPVRHFNNHEDQAIKKEMFSFYAQQVH